MRLIDADALMRDIEKYHLSDGKFQHWVEVQPTIEPERKKGKWERHYSRPNVYEDLYWHCSECGYKSDNQYANAYYNYCPNCGADMRGEQG